MNRTPRQSTAQPGSTPKTARILRGAGGTSARRPHRISEKLSAQQCAENRALSVPPPSDDCCRCLVSIFVHYSEIFFRKALPVRPCCRELVRATANRTTRGSSTKGVLGKLHKATQHPKCELVKTIAWKVCGKSRSKWPTCNPLLRKFFPKSRKSS